jgi:hypothetical protein
MTGDRLGGPFREGLAQEFRTLQAPVDPDLFPAALGHRGNTHVLLQFISTPEPFPLLTEGGQQAWGELRAGTRTTRPSCA